MFARDKRIGPYTYVYLVENVREEGRTKQRMQCRSPSPCGRSECASAPAGRSRRRSPNLTRNIIPPYWGHERADARVPVGEDKGSLRGRPPPQPDDERRRGGPKN